MSFLGPFIDTCAPVAAEWAGENKIPVIMTCSLSTKVSIDNSNDYTFTAGGNAWAWAKVYAANAIEKGYKKIYYVGNEGGVPDDVYNFFWREMATLDPAAENLGNTRVTGQETDYSAVIQTILSKNPDYIITSLTGGAAITFMQQGIQFGLFDNAEMAGVYILGGDHTESMGQDYPFGKVGAICWYPYAFSSMKDFTDELYEKMGLIPGDATMSWYTAAIMACEAVKAAGVDVTADKIVEQLDTIKKRFSYRRDQLQRVSPAYVPHVLRDEHL